MIVYQVKKRPGDLGILTPDGELTAGREDELKVFLREALDGVNHVVLNLKYVTDMDISCLHLLCSIYRTALLHEKYFSVAGGSPGIFKRVVESVDPERCMNCLPYKRCLWRAQFETSSPWSNA